MSTTATITSLATLSSVAADDVLPIVDVHDTTQAPSGSTKKVTVATLLTGYLTSATAASTYLPLSGGTLTGASLALSADSAEVSTTFGGVTTTRLFTDAGGGAISVDGANNFRVKTGGKTGTVQLTVSPTGVAVAGALSVGGAVTIGTNGFTLGSSIGFTTDNVADIGGPSANRPRDVNVARNVIVGGNLTHQGASIGFYNRTPTARPSITVSRTGADALALALLNALGDVVGVGLVHDATA